MRDQLESMINMKFQTEISELLIIKLGPIINNKDPGYAKPADHKSPQERNNFVSSNSGRSFSLNSPDKVIKSHNNEHFVTTYRKEQS